MCCVPPPCTGNQFADECVVCAGCFFVFPLSGELEVIDVVDLLFVFVVCLAQCDCGERVDVLR